MDGRPEQPQVSGIKGVPLPVDMLADIVQPDAFAERDPREWVPINEAMWTRPLILNVSQGYWIHLLKVGRPGVINRHRHSSQVNIFTLKGQWLYPEKDWVAVPGTYVFEPPGDVHTLVVPEGGAEMIFLSFVTGALLYVDEKGALTGYDDVFTRIDQARSHYTAIGLGADFVKRMIR
jgi:hypothetical protein